MDKAFGFQFNYGFFDRDHDEQFDAVAMSNGKSKSGDAKGSASSGKAAASKPGSGQKGVVSPAKTSGPGKTPPPPAAPAGPPPPLFRKIDWITFLVTTLVTFTGYYLTLSPDLTLQDSGELAVGSFYAGIPHPPGYPVWTI